MKRTFTLAALAALLTFCLCAAGESMLAASGSHALYLDESGRVWAWGSNHRGESVPTDAAAWVSVPQQVFEGAKQIACGRQFSCALGEDGTLWSWGGAHGETPDTGSATAGAPALLLKDVTQVSACEDACACVLSDGRVAYLSGGEAAQYFGTDAVKTACGANFMIWLDSAGDVYFIGNTDYLPSDAAAETPAKIASACADIYADGQTGALVLNSGEMRVFGASGSEGRLGIDTNEWIRSPAANGVKNVRAGVCGVSASGAIDADGAFYAWGTLYSYFTAFDERGEMYFSESGGTLINYGKTPIKLYDGVKCAAFGEAFGVLELNDGTLLSWGSNEWGQLGNGFNTSFELIAGEDEDDYEIDVTENYQAVFPLQVKIPR
ncbi:MAG: hypothetical protein IKR85_00385 [Clostridia bacterium]|nr:hypothetical protein [Clostridia bacterium]